MSWIFRGLSSSSGILITHFNSSINIGDNGLREDLLSFLISSFSGLAPLLLGSGEEELYGRKHGLAKMAHFRKARRHRVEKHHLR